MSDARTAAHPRLSLNQATIKHAALAEALRVTAGAGIQAIGVWREPVAEVGIGEAERMIADSGLRVSTYCRGGFFTPVEGAARRRALDDNRRAIDETARVAAAGGRGVTIYSALVVAVVFGSGTFLLLQRDLTRVVVGIILVSNSAVLFIISAGLSRGVAPILPLEDGGAKVARRDLVPGVGERAHRCGSDLPARSRDEDLHRQLWSIATRA